MISLPLSPKCVPLLVLNIIPTSLFKDVFSFLGPFLFSVVNRSLSSGCVPDYFKHAIVQSLLKKPSLDPLLPNNYRPISKLPFISKVLEKVSVWFLCGAQY